MAGGGKTKSPEAEALRAAYMAPTVEDVLVEFWITP